MPDVREILAALSPEDKVVWQMARNKMRSAYIDVCYATIGTVAWKIEDDAFLDLIDIKLALVFDRSGRLNSIKEIVTTDDAKPIESDIEKAEDARKEKAKVEPSAASKGLLAMREENTKTTVLPPNALQPKD